MAQPPEAQWQAPFDPPLGGSGLEGRAASVVAGEPKAHPRARLLHPLRRLRAALGRLPAALGSPLRRPRRTPAAAAPWVGGLEADARREAERPEADTPGG